MIEKIQSWLGKNESCSSISKEDFIVGASLLLQCNSNRFMYNFLVKNYKSQLNKLVYELKKHLKILLSKVTLVELEKMRPQVEKIREEVEKITSSDNAVAAYRGKRPDHDSLPEHIKVLYEQTLTLLRKERQLTERLKLLASAPPCDRHEYTVQLVELDDKRHDYWEKYDHFDMTAYKNSMAEHEQTVSERSEDPTLIAKMISTNRSYISNNIKKLSKLAGNSLEKAKYEELKASVQSRYDDNVKLGAVTSDDVKKKLFDLGIKV